MPIEYKDFAECIRNIYAEGNIKSGYNLLLDIVNQEQQDNEGNPITCTYIIEKYKDFISSWNYKYKKKEESGFLSKSAEEERLPIWEFLARGKYKEDFSVLSSNPTRDKYIFGDINYNEFKHIKNEIEKLRRLYSSTGN